MRHHLDDSYSRHSPQSSDPDSSTRRQKQTTKPKKPQNLTRSLQTALSKLQASVQLHAFSPLSAHSAQQSSVSTRNKRDPPQLPLSLFISSVKPTHPAELPLSIPLVRKNQTPTRQVLVSARLSGAPQRSVLLYVSSGAHRKRSPNQKSAGALPGSPNPQAPSPAAPTLSRTRIRSERRRCPCQLRASTDSPSVAPSSRSASAS